MTTRDYTALHQAVAALAGVCDYAETQDMRGFNGTDAYLGHAMADMGAEAWDDAMALAAWDMIRKYAKTQLKPNFGIEYDELPVPPGAEELLDERRAEAREKARDKVREHRAAQARRANSFVLCEGEESLVILKFQPPRDKLWNWVTEAKAIPGRAFKSSYNGHRDVNLYPFTSLARVVEFADSHDVPVTPEVRALAEIAKARHAEALKAARSRPDLYLDSQGRLTLNRGMDGQTRLLNDALRQLNRGYSTWVRGESVHRPPYRNPEALKKIIAEFGLTVSPGAQELIDKEAERQQRNLAASVAAVAEPMEDVPGLAEEITIKPQQWPVLRWIAELGNKATFIGDDMGLGKTLSSTASVALLNAFPLVIICKPDLAENWINEIGKFFPGWNVYKAETTKAKPIPHDTDAVVVGSAVAAHWVKAINLLQPKALILDESQIAKNEKAARTKAVKAIAAPIVERDGVRLLASGTALMNRPRELAAQLEIIGKIDVFGGTGTFLVRYCEDRAKSNEFGRNFDGANHLDELHHLLRAEGLMIRRKKDILGLPVCHEPVDRIGMDQLDPQTMAQYVTAEADVVSYLAAEAKKLAEQFGVDPHDARVRAAMKAKAAEHLVLINTLRGLVGRAKLPYVSRWVADKVAQGEKVMVAAHHKEVYGPLASTFGGLKIVGDQTGKAKEADKYTFQYNPNAKVITVAIEAGGTGHTLTAARLGILAELPWTPGGRDQMRDRMNRIGQTREMWFHTVVATGTIDDYMFSVITEKAKVLKAVLDGRSSHGVEEDENSAVADVAWKLAMQGIQGYGGRA